MSKTNTNQFPELVLNVSSKLKYVWIGLGAYYLGDAVGDYMTKNDFDRTAAIYEKNSRDPVGLMVDLSEDRGVGLGYPLFRNTYRAIDNMSVTAMYCIKDKQGLADALKITRDQDLDAKIAVYNKHFPPQVIACMGKHTEEVATSYRTSMFFNLASAVFFIGLSIASQKSNELLRKTLGKDNNPGAHGPQ